MNDDKEFGKEDDIYSAGYWHAMHNIDTDLNNEKINITDMAAKLQLFKTQLNCFKEAVDAGCYQQALKCYTSITEIIPIDSPYHQVCLKELQTICAINKRYGHTVPEDEIMAWCEFGRHSEPVQQPMRQFQNYQHPIHNARFKQPFNWDNGPQVPVLPYTANFAKYR